MLRLAQKELVRLSRCPRLRQFLILSITLKMDFMAQNLGDKLFPDDPESSDVYQSTRLALEKSLH